MWNSFLVKTVVSSKELNYIHKGPVGFLNIHFLSMFELVKLHRIQNDPLTRFSSDHKPDLLAKSLWQQAMQTTFTT